VGVCAVEVGEHVLKLNPICGACYQALAGSYVLLRRFEDAVAIYARAENLGLEMPAHPAHALALLFSGDAEAALAEWRRFPPTVRLGGSAMVFHALGQTAEYEQALAELNELVRAQPEASILLARVYSFAGDIGPAFEILNGLPRLPAQIFSDPEFDSLRDHDRYEELLEKAGIWPDDWRDEIEFNFELPE
jgi:tetratricopeptide (TPR) repeat protein